MAGPSWRLGKAGASGKNIEMSLLGIFCAADRLHRSRGDGGLDLRTLGRGRSTQARGCARLPDRLADSARGVRRLARQSLLPLPPSIRRCWRFGAVRIEGWIGNAILRAAALVGVSSWCLAAPLTLPILPVDVFIRYPRAIGFMPSAGEHQILGELPQYYADMFGWREMAEKIAAVYWSLPPQDRARAVFYGENYGEAAAIDVFGRRLGLPPAISGHNNYYIWGPRGHDGSVMIIIGGSTEALRRAVPVV